MKKSLSILLILLLDGALLAGCGAKGKPAESGFTKETALEAVGNYCRETYGWDPEESDPAVMYLEVSEETETELLLIFRSYTGAFVHFRVDKATGTAKMTEVVPALGIEDEAGTLDLQDYLPGK